MWSSPNTVWPTWTQHVSHEPVAPDVMMSTPSSLKGDVEMVAEFLFASGA